MKRTNATLALVALGALVAGLSGCATSESVDKKIAESQAKTDKKIEGVETQVEELQTKQKATETKVEQQGQDIQKLSQSAQEALKRAQEAGVLAKGRVVYEQAFTEDRIKFKTGSADLDKNAMEALDEFAAKVKGMGKGFYYEIQGHTDNTGTDEINFQLGDKRAEAVRRYLALKHQFPLPRVVTISYGATMPLEPNKTSKGRAANRRVVIVVLE